MAEPVELVLRQERAIDTVMRSGRRRKKPATCTSKSSSIMDSGYPAKGPIIRMIVGSTTALKIYGRPHAPKINTTKPGGGTIHQGVRALGVVGVSE